MVLVLILLVGAYFRFIGLNWDENHHQHPDERFITMVANAIKGVNGVSEYFDTANSTLNPLNYGSYTYGMLPLFITRMVAEWVKMADYDPITLVGRVMSGLFDLAAIWMLYLLRQTPVQQAHRHVSGRAVCSRGASNPTFALFCGRFVFHRFCYRQPVFRQPGDPDPSSGRKSYPAQAGLFCPVWPGW